MKALFMLDSLGRGGAETLVLDTCRSARRSGLEVHLLATGDGELQDEFRAAGISFSEELRRGPLDPRLIARLRKIVSTEAFDVVHCHQAVEALHAYLALRGSNTSLVLTHHLGDADLKNRVALRFLMGRVDRNLAVSRHVLNRLCSNLGLSRIPENFSVLPNGIDLERADAAHEERSRILEEFGLKNDDFIAAMVGNFYPTNDRKDQLTVCKALPEIVRSAPNFHFLFIGRPDGEHGTSAKCRSLCEATGIDRHVNFLGSRDDVPRLLKAVDLFIFSSFDEGLPIAAIEAMAAGVPLLACDIDPLLEVTDDGRVAAIFKAGDSADLSRHALELYRSPEKRQRFAQAGREWAVSNFSIDTYLSKLMDVYREL